MQVCLHTQLTSHLILPLQDTRKRNSSALEQEETWSPDEALVASLAGAVSRNAERAGLVWPPSGGPTAAGWHPDNRVTGAEEGTDKQLGRASLLKCSRGCVAILYLGLFCQCANRALNFSAP